jgi:type IV secretion system protein VirB6
VAATPFESIASSVNTFFGAGLGSSVTSILTAIVSPLLATVTLWIIIQGILVMRGDIDTRVGITRIIRVVLVVGLLTSTSDYDAYVQTFFQVELPDWIASAVSNNEIASPPQAFDQVWQNTVHQIAIVQSELSLFDVVDGVALDLVEFVTNIILLVTFAVYEIAQVMVGIVLVIGPIVLIGYLFDATKRVAENWLGKVVGLSLLTLLVNVVIQIILQGDRQYITSVSSQAAAGGTISGQIQQLFALCMFLGVSAFIVILLPGIAAAIGGGIGFDVGGLTRRAMTMAASPATRAAPALAPASVPAATPRNVSTTLRRLAG